MPLQTCDTQIDSVCQPFTAVSNSFAPKTLKSVYSFESNSQTSDMRCPYCGKMNVYVHARHSTEIKDFPFLPKHRQSLVFYYHGYKCRECGHHFMEPIPAKVPNTRITIQAAEESGIPQLQKFAKLKVRRLKGLVAHATHPISTGKLEGTNNKIKVAKRIAFGYRDEGYFFTLIRYQSSLGLPTIP